MWSPVSAAELSQRSGQVVPRAICHLGTLWGLCLCQPDSVPVHESCTVSLVFRLDREACRPSGGCECGDMPRAHELDILLHVALPIFPQLAPFVHAAGSSWTFSRSSRTPTFFAGSYCILVTWPPGLKQIIDLFFVRCDLAWHAEGSPPLRARRAVLRCRRSLLSRCSHVAATLNSAGHF
jgi:hypothetical protein